MMAANKIKLKNLSKKRDRGAKRALKLLKKPDLLLATILVGNNFANILASSIVYAMTNLSLLLMAFLASSKSL